MSTFGKVSCGILVVFIVFSLSYNQQILNSKIQNLKSIVKDQGEILELKSRNIGLKNQCIQTLQEQNKELDKKLQSATSETVTVTAYTARYNECDNTPTQTATMTKTRPGVGAAVSRDLIHFLGKRIYVEGVGIREVDDVMNERWNKKIDILVPSINIAKEFGVKESKVVVIN